MSSSGWDTGYPPPQELGIHSRYLEAIRYINLSPSWLHQPSGRAVAVGGDIFYSPNSSFAPARPPPAGQEIFRDPAKDDVGEFHQPRWWTPSAPYLPFLPTFPNFHLPPFHVLFHKPRVHRRNRIQMDSGDALEWANLEQRLKRVIQQFQSGYGIPASQTIPIIATTLACQGTYQNLGQLSVAEKRSRDWLSVWMAIISFCIAVAQAIDGEDDDVMCPAWFRCLVKYVDERTASGLRQQLAQFTQSYSRAGIFLNLLEDANIQRPTVEFYVKFSIPVWYHWGIREEALARANPAGFSRFVPPPHLLQTARLFLLKEPAIVQNANNRPWEVFFEERKRRAATNAGPMPRKKPILKVFVWEKNSDGEWIRIIVHSEETQIILQEHGRRQKVFDEWANEWDCCKAMGNLDPDETQAVHWNDHNLDTLPVPVSGSPTHCGIWADSSGAFPVIPDDFVQYPEHTPGPSSTFGSSSSEQPHTEYLLSPSSDGDDDWSSEEYDPVNILRLFYGFVPPPHSRNQSCFPAYKVDGIDAQNLAKGVGKIQISANYIKSSLGQAAVNFFWAISQKKFVCPNDEIYDLAYNNVHGVKKSLRLSYMRKLPGDIFIFVFKDHATVPWSIAVTNIMDAIFVLRLDSLLNDYEIACQLLNRGVRFLTLLHLPIFTTTAAPTSIPRIRLSSYSFSLDDYTAYCHERDEMLRNPRISRGALKRGGILWRLAMGTASFHNVLSGPSTAVTARHQCMSLNPGDKFMWCDDSLDQSEIDIICGVYYVFTGQSSQKATKSWWPPVQVWENNMRLGFWNEEYESLYTTRLRELRSGTAVPLTSEQWRKRIRPFAVVRRAFDNTSKLANILLHSLSLGL